MADLGYVKPHQATGQALAGIGQLIGETRAKIKEQAGNKAVREAIESGNPEMLKQLMEEYPEHYEKAKAFFDLQKEFSNENLRSIWKSSSEALAQPGLDAKIKYLQYKADEIKEKGGNPQPYLEALGVAEKSGEEALDKLLTQSMTVAERLGAVEPLGDGKGRVRGLVGSPTTVLINGKPYFTGVHQGEDGTPEVMSLAYPEGSSLVNRLGLTAQEEADLEVDTSKEIKKQQERQALIQKSADEAVTSIQALDSAIATNNQGIRLLEQEGAQTGVINQLLPSVKASSQALDNLVGRMGLDMLSFFKGSISDGERTTAMALAFPKGMQPKDAAKWLRQRNAIQQRMKAKILDFVKEAIENDMTPAEYYVKKFKSEKENTSTNVQAGSTKTAAQKLQELREGTTNE